MGERARYTASGCASMVLSYSSDRQTKKSGREPQAPNRLLALNATRPPLVSFDVSAQGPQAVLEVGVPAFELVEIADLGGALGR